MICVPDKRLQEQLTLGIPLLFLEGTEAVDTDQNDLFKNSVFQSPTKGLSLYACYP